MSTVLPVLINWLQQYGYPTLWFGVLISLLPGSILGASCEARDDALTAISGFITSILVTIYLTVHLVRMLQCIKAVKLYKRANAFIVYGKEKTESLRP